MIIAMKHTLVSTNDITNCIHSIQQTISVVNNTIMTPINHPPIIQVVHLQKVHVYLHYNIQLATMNSIITTYETILSPHPMKSIFLITDHHK